MAVSESVPQVSICIANYNGETLLRECIDSVLAQGLGDQVEVIVHDDASTDASLGLLESQYPWVRVLRSERNVGFCVSNNRMAAAARGHYLLLLNNDAVLFPDAIAVLVDGMSRFADDRAILSLPQYDYESGDLVDRGVVLDPMHTPVPNLSEERTEIAFVIGACMFMPRALWDELGGFPDWFESLAEDLYLCAAARLRGIPVRVLAESGYRHRQGASFGGNRIGQKGVATTYKRRFLSERNRLYAMLMSWPGISVIPVAIVQIVLMVFEGVLLLLMKRDRRVWTEIYGAALSEVFTKRTLWLRGRRALQRYRAVSLFAYLRAFVWTPQKLRILLRHGLPRLS